jgi:CubicO group peptidase (beta-lactamase class C family)
VTGSWSGANGVVGRVAPGFEIVAEALERNLATGEDLGAQVSLVRDGEVLVDVRAGVGVDGEPLPAGALHPLFSVTKGVTATVVALLVDDGLLDLDAPVVRYWPEYGQNGKAATTVLQLLSHQAGIPGFDRAPSLDELGDWDALVERLAAQAPLWEPGSAHGYHALTVGFLAGELVRRISGETVGALLRRRIAGPLGLDLWIGMPDDVEHRVQDNARAFATPGVGEAFGVAASTVGSPTWYAFANPPVSSAMFDDHDLLRIELPAANGLADALSLARLYAALATPSADAPLVSAATVARMATPVTTGFDRVLVGQRTRYGALWFSGTPDEPMLGPRSFGHNGFGGSLAFADPVSGVGFAYLVNRPQLGPNPFPRAVRVVEAVRTALSRGQ